MILVVGYTTSPGTGGYGDQEDSRQTSGHHLPPPTQIYSRSQSKHNPNNSCFAALPSRFYSLYTYIMQYSAQRRELSK